MYHTDRQEISLRDWNQDNSYIQVWRDKIQHKPGGMLVEAVENGNRFLYVLIASVCSPADRLSDGNARPH
jgi:hypothetical protein